MKARSILALLGVVCLLSPIWAADPIGRREPLTADLAAVPGEAVAVVHIRVADIWKSDSLKELRETVLKAGAKALEGFDKRFLPTPSSIDRLTVVVLPRDPELKQQPAVLGILAFNKPYDKDALLKSAMPDAVENKTTNGSFYIDAKNEIAVFFISDQVLAFGQIPAIEMLVDGRAKPKGGITEALYVVDMKRHITVVGNLSFLPAKAVEEAPAPVRPLLAAKLATLSLDLAENTTLEANLYFASEQAATRGMVALDDLAKLGRKYVKDGREEMLSKVLGDGKPAPLDKLPEAAAALLGLGAMERADEFLAKPPLKQDKNLVKLTVTVPSMSYTAMAPIAIGLLLPAVQKVREAAARTQSMNNLRQMGLAMHNHNDTVGSLPGPICDKNGKPLLSWRVAILPFIEQENLYQQFKLDEPWDSDHNKKLVPMMPAIYLNRQAPPSQPGFTHYRMVYGKDVVFGINQKKTIQGIADGSSNTILAFEAADPVAWTSPEESPYDAKKPLPRFAKFSSAGFGALFGDAAVRMIPPSTPEETIRLLLTDADGKAVRLP